MGKAKVDLLDLDVHFDDGDDAKAFIKLLQFINPESNGQVVRKKSDGTFLIDIAPCFGSIKDFFPPEALAGEWVEIDLKNFK
jgi:hypothetical protein